jgi:hypothetical protein
MSSVPHGRQAKGPILGTFNSEEGSLALKHPILSSSTSSVSFQMTIVRTSLAKVIVDNGFIIRALAYQSELSNRFGHISATPAPSLGPERLFSAHDTRLPRSTNLPRLDSGSDTEYAPSSNSGQASNLGPSSDLREASTFDARDGVDLINSIPHPRVSRSCQVPGCSVCRIRESSNETYSRAPQSRLSRSMHKILS